MTAFIDTETRTSDRLQALLVNYDLAHAEAKKAEEALRAITDGIKAELSALFPDERDVRVESPYLAKPLRLQAIESWRVDTRKLKAEAPEVYVRYAKQSTSWRLAAMA